tara:strand:- start:1968 stop:2306 length:339 start_codon:yes stop_codon:yes gene_type:complete
MINHSFKTDRIYNFPQEISLIIERDKITFNDPSRNIAGIIDLEENDIITKVYDNYEKAINDIEDESELRLIEAPSINLVKSLAKTRTMNCYDNGKHNWLSPLEATKLFGKEI